MFSFFKNVLKLSYNKLFPGDITPDPCFREEESLFLLSENVPKLSYSNAEFKKSPGDNTPDLRSRVGKFAPLSENVPTYYLNSPKSMQNSKISRR